MYKMKFKRQVYEAKSMTEYILNGHSETETANEFGVTPVTVRRRLKMLGYTYADLVEFRKTINKKEAAI